MVLDPLTLGTLIATTVLGGLTLLVNLWQSFKLNHFSLKCSDCCSLNMIGGATASGADTTTKPNIVLSTKNDP